MLEFLLVVALVAIAVIIAKNSKMKSECKTRELNLNKMLDSKKFELVNEERKHDVTKSKIDNLERDIKSYEEDIVVYKKAVKDGVSFSQAKMQIQEYERVAVQQEELARVLKEQARRTSDLKKPPTNSVRRDNSSKRNSSSSSTQWDDFNGGYSGSGGYSSGGSSSSSDSSSSYSGSGGDFGGGGGGSDW